MMKKLSSFQRKKHGEKKQFYYDSRTFAKTFLFITVLVDGMTDEITSLILETILTP